MRLLCARATRQALSRVHLPPSSTQLHHQPASVLTARPAPQKPATCSSPGPMQSALTRDVRGYSAAAGQQYGAHPSGSRQEGASATAKGQVQDQPHQQQECPLRTPLLLISDIDDTITGPCEDSDRGTAALREVWAWLRRACAAPAPAPLPADDAPDSQQPPQPLLAYNTGRSLPLFLAISSEKAAVMPRPDALICGVGTRVYWPRASATAAPPSAAAGSAGGSSSDDVGVWAWREARGWVEDVGWRAHISAGWEVGDVERVVGRLAGELGEGRLRPVPDARENHSHKRTLYVSAPTAPDTLAALESGLADAGVDALLIHGPHTGGERDAEGRVAWRFVDILPARAGKAAAAEYVRSALGVHYAHTVVAGDAPNDLLALDAGGWHAVVVANAQPEVRQWAQSHPSLLTPQEAHQDGKLEGAGSPDAAAVHDDVAQEQALQAAGQADGGRVVLASRPRAEGVLQGLQALGFLPQQLVV